MGLQKEKSINIDPNVLQQKASDPYSSIWVSASAGTGKTKVLTDRVLRLLLPRFDGSPGTPAHKILCLTFTKAAANEMALRIQSKLSSWAIMDTDELRDVLKRLLSLDPTEEQVDAARRAFAENIDSGSALRIMTMHSFCQSVLGRFPLEAGLSPYADVLDEYDASQLLKKAQNTALQVLQSDDMIGSYEAKAFNNLLSNLDESRFLSLISQIMSERNQLKNVISQHGSIEGVYIAICDFYKIDFKLSVELLHNSLCEGADEQKLGYVADILIEDGGKTAQKDGYGIKQWIKAPFQERLSLLQDYRSIFLKTDGDIRTHNFPTKSVIKRCAESDSILRAESCRLADVAEKEKRLCSATFTRDLLIIGSKILDIYQSQKAQQGVLDFDDLVIKTLDLLRSQGKWVMYKLDEGLDHILVDEAQDTNPEQWGIVQALCAEFFDGEGARDNIVRTAFAVGDIKQSIYSFQRAAPEEFKSVQKSLNQKIKASGYRNSLIELETSFRTTPSVLRVVDSVFHDDPFNSYVGGGKVNHISFRSEQAGCVELWPLYETQEKLDRDPWTIPTEIVEQNSTSVLLAEKIATTIKNWLDRKDILDSYDRAIQPGDIMILVRSRNSFVENLIRALKNKNVLVAGSDRMVLSDQLVVQDMLALARFCLLPDDDLTLAEVLKSPLVGLTEEDLFSLAYNRKGTLWTELCNFDFEKLASVKNDVSFIQDAKCEEVRLYLAELIGRCRQMGVYEFFNFVLTQPCPCNKLSGLSALKLRLGDDLFDPLQEFLNDALNFGYDHIDNMQVFLEHFKSQNSQIKREMEEGGDSVRIMTVHGSKGLQAPIVILPDTILSTASKKPSRLLWPSSVGTDFPLFSTNSANDPAPYSNLYRRREHLDREEYFRLLYVAMTRAEERLYIAGHVGSKKPNEASWYFAIQNAMEDDPQCQVCDDGSLKVSCEQISKPDKQEEIADINIQDYKSPDWLQHNAPEEPLPPRPLVPSRPSEEDQEISMSPLISGQDNRFKRGNITHKLLQFLPDLDHGMRRNAAQKFMQNYAIDLSHSVRDSIVNEVLNILEDITYAPYFAAGSIAEVPVTGLTDDGRVVSGQIDRLVVEKDKVLILDYKSNRPPPVHAEDVQEVYKKQLRAYRDSISKIYPGRAISCALLWTDGPRFMIMDDYL